MFGRYRDSTARRSRVHASAPREGPGSNRRVRQVPDTAEYAMRQSQPPEREIWRLLLFRKGGSELLLSSGIDDSRRLPVFCVPRWQRTAPHLNAGIRHRWGIE